MNPWLQRLLIAWGASIVTSTALVITADDKAKKKQRKVKRSAVKSAGQTAAKDRDEEVQEGLTLEEFQQNLRVLGTSVRDRAKALVTRTPPPAESGAVDDAAREPDEVQGKDGRTVTKRKRKPAFAKGGAARRGKVDARGKSSARGKTDARGKAGGKKQRRDDLPDATLFESAKESMRQVVSEEAQRKLDESPVGGAVAALKKAGSFVAEKAEQAKDALGDAVPEDFDQRLKNAGSAVKSGAKKLGQTVSQNVQSGLRALEDDAASSRSTPATPPPPAHEGVGPNDTSLTTTSDAPSPRAEGLEAAEAIDKLKASLEGMGDWLQGPGSPGYSKGGRVRAPGTSSDVVEAKMDGRDAPKPPQP